MFAPINQIQSPNDGDDDQAERRHDWENRYSAIKEPVQESFLGYYSHDFGQADEDFACCGGVLTASNPLRISYERLIKESFDLASPKMKAKKRKAEVVNGGGRVIRATGRKDRHSKVCTARGPRDRRMRLSPTTAIQFYDVQDRLGYDRPSKAIDWLINEAKTAIDALASDSNAPENYSLSIPNHKEKQKHDFNDDTLVSGFSCFGDEPPYVADLEAYLDKDFSSLLLPNYQQGSCSALIPETNWEMARLKKMVTWNHRKENSDCIRGGGEEAEQYSSGNSVALDAAEQPILFTQREPLQSSVINYSLMNNDFAGFNFSNELSKITVSAAMKQDENLKKKKKKEVLVFSMPSTTPHSQD